MTIFNGWNLHYDLCGCFTKGAKFTRELRSNATILDRTKNTTRPLDSISENVDCSKGAFEWYRDELILFDTGRLSFNVKRALALLNLSIVIRTNSNYSTFSGERRESYWPLWYMTWRIDNYIRTRNEWMPASILSQISSMRIYWPTAFVQDEIRW